jgi:hypothetical protein
MSMLSVSAYDMLNVIVDGAVTVHVLRLGLIDRGFPARLASGALMDRLIELCEHQAIVFCAETNYGGPQCDVSAGRSTVELIAAWERIFGPHGPAEAEVTSGTISIEPTELGKTIASDSKYEVYLPLLREFWGWPDESHSESC